MVTVRSSVLALTSRWRAAVRSLWTLRDSRAMFCGTILTGTLCIWETIYSLQTPCLVSTDVFTAECAEPLRTLLNVQIVKIVIVVAATRLSERMFAVAIAQLGFQPCYQVASNNRVGGWAAASSREVYTEIVEVTLESHKQLVALVLLSVVVLVALLGSLCHLIWETPHWSAYYTATCGERLPAWDFCRLAAQWPDLIQVVDTCVNTYIAGLTVMMRAEMWSPVFIHALKETQTHWLHRLLLVHWFNIPFGALSLFCFGIGIKIKLRTASRNQMVAFTAASFIVILGCLCLFAWTTGLDITCSKFARRIFRGSIFSTRTAVFPHPPYCDCPPNQPLARRSSVVQRWKGRQRHRQRAGMKNLQAQLQLAFQVCLTCVAFGSPVFVWILSLIRLAFAVCLISAADVPAEFGDLQNKGAGFGLLVDAWELQHAVKAFLAGRKHEGRVTRIMGTYSRMDDTLTISYRWQDEEVEICPGLRLNFSNWQLQEMCNAISVARCQYVWIDKLALPLDASPLKQTLLSRMMAIYSTSRMTVVMRSLEPEGSRYHQRAWTLQEYCNARELLVVTQAPDRRGSGQEDGLSAVSSDEELELPKLRKWHISRQQSCRPYWLFRFDKDHVLGDLRGTLESYQSLSSRLVSKYSEDSVRALFPMIFNTPCEDQDELEGLVADVQLLVAGLGEPLSGVGNLLRSDVLVLSKSRMKLPVDLELS